MIRTVLIANRGEIACRIIRTARRMGIATVAVHSDADAGALHVRMADTAIRIGGAAAAESYLDADAIVAAARASGADAVHPGYGFLSENEAFANACAGAGLIFVGPSAAAIHAMADKARARALMVEAGVAVVPGYDGDDQSPGRLAEEARGIGYPVLVKAAAGGGGRGMRKVERPEDLPAALESARREAENAFGDGRLLLEKLVVDARHIEVQIFADSHGNCIHLGERDCSAQRRHQKIVEESPSPFHDPSMSLAMAVDAVAAAKAIRYSGAGTVEFIVAADRGYFFLEMNTRLQVEHPVTEMVTGLDLVEWQLRIASGEKLPLGEEDIDFSGHAVEARLYAEDPYRNFRPQTGRVLYWRPESESRARIDNGVAEGMTVSPYYDPMIAKFVAHGRDRAEAVGRLRKALLDRPLFGLRTNRSFLLDLLASEEFAAGTVTTTLLDRWAEDDAEILACPKPATLHFAIAAAWLALSSGGDWFRSTGIAVCPVTLECEGERREALVRFERGAFAGVSVAGEDVDLNSVTVSDEGVRFVSGGRLHAAVVAADGRDLWLDLDGRTFRFTEPELLAAGRPAADPSLVVSPVSGLLRSLSVRVGDTVESGRAIAMVEAMKMETVLAASASGVVKSVRAAIGDQVRAGDVIAELDIAR